MLDLVSRAVVAAQALAMCCACVLVFADAPSSTEVGRAIVGLYFFAKAGLALLREDVRWVRSYFGEWFNLYRSGLSYPIVSGFLSMALLPDADRYCTRSLTCARYVVCVLSGCTSVFLLLT